MKLLRRNKTKPCPLCGRRLIEIGLLEPPYRKWAHQTPVEDAECQSNKGGIMAKEISEEGTQWLMNYVALSLKLLLEAHPEILQQVKEKLGVMPEEIK